MADLETPIVENSHRHEDPITHEPGAHPVATTVGAAGMGATGAAVGLIVGGPVGGVIGAVIGAVAGGLGGSAVGEAADPTILDEPTKDHLNRTDRAEHESASEYVIAPDGHWERNEITIPPAETALEPEPIAIAAPAAPITNAAPTAIGSHAARSSEISHEAIAARAYSYYEAGGYREGHDVDDWLRSESELQRVASPAPAEAILV